MNSENTILKVWNRTACFSLPFSKGTRIWKEKFWITAHDEFEAMDLISRFILVKKETGGEFEKFDNDLTICEMSPRSRRPCIHGQIMDIVEEECKNERVCD